MHHPLSPCRWPEFIVSCHYAPSAPRTEWASKFFACERRALLPLVNFFVFVSLPTDIYISFDTSSTFRVSYHCTFLRLRCSRRRSVSIESAACSLYLLVDTQASSVVIFVSRHQFPEPAIHQFCLIIRIVEGNCCFMERQSSASGVTPLLPPLNYVSEMVPSMPWPVSAGMQGSISCSEFTADASESFNPTPQMNASGVFSSRNMSHADSHQPVFSPDVDARPMIQSVPSQANFDAAARGPYEPTRAMKRKASVSPPGKAEFNATWAADRGNGKVRAVDLDPGVEEMDEDGKKMWVLQLLSEEVKEHMEVSDIRKGPSEYDVLKTAFDVIRAWQDYDQQRAQQINAFQEALQVAQSHWLKEKVRREAVELRLVQTERDVMTLNTKVGKRAATIETATHDLEETKAGLRRSKDELHSKIDEAQRDVDLIKQLSADLVSTRAELQRYQERYAR
ncbi:hypothetical protein DENSPDRAFT_690130 [Dentipellis sp. KUC8613]|nr:hypothetical protein DENSPDRAFT_690130 [Dentipellis sp. KUC8613]